MFHVEPAVAAAATIEWTPEGTIILAVLAAGILIAILAGRPR